MQTAPEWRCRAATHAARCIASVLLLLFCPLACASNPAGQGAPQEAGVQLLLAPGDSYRIPETDLTITFVRVVEDSRCPTGVTCIREGDASVLLRLDKPGSPSSELTLHTSGPSSGEQTAGAVAITLTGVTPYPSENSKPRPDEYRVTLLIRKK